MEQTSIALNIQNGTSSSATLQRQRGRSVFISSVPCVASITIKCLCRYQARHKRRVNICSSYDFDRNKRIA